MKESPLPFNAEMVLAILSGQKTQTRRPMDPQPQLYSGWDGAGDMDVSVWYPREGSKRALHYASESHFRKGVVRDFSPCGGPGDLIWGREAHRLLACTCSETCRVPGKVWYEADQSGYRGAELERLRPSIHMHRWASRLNLEITRTRAEPLLEITEDDALAEGGVTRIADRMFAANLPPGLDDSPYPSAKAAFLSRWDAIYPRPASALSPWVWVYEFRRIQ